MHRHTSPIFGIFRTASKQGYWCKTRYIANILSNLVQTEVACKRRFLKNDLRIFGINSIVSENVENFFFRQFQNPTTLLIF